MQLRSLPLVAALCSFVQLTAHAAPGAEPIAGFRVGPGAPFRLGPLHLHTDGNFYGAMAGTGNAFGGDTGNGALFRLTPSGKIDWLSFSGTGGPRPGKSPEGGLVLRPDGWLWGKTTAGGPAGTMGSVYRIRAESGEFQSMVGFLNGQFTTFPGQYPNNELVSDGTGWLWGTANQGGAGFGVIYKVNEVTGEFKTAAILTSGSGKPTGPGQLTFHDGYIWGVSGGGAHSSGALFRIDPSAALPVVPEIIADFTGTATIAPKPRGSGVTGRLTADGLGYLWGAAETGGGGSTLGALFKLKIADVGTGTYPVTTVIEFTGTSGAVKGQKPRGSLVADGDGLLWGVTAIGGTGGVSGLGTVFKVNPADNTLTTVVDFGAPANAGIGVTSPANPLVYDGNGYMWGIATNGSSEHWAVYKVKVADGTLSKVAEYRASGPTPDGIAPKAAPVGRMANDWLYGTTSAGGKYNFGTLYRVNAATGEHQTLVHFTGNTGAAAGAMASAKLHYHTDGTLWGTTQGGGWNGNGTVFRFNPATGIFTHIASFTIAGAAPLGKLTTGNDGFIWGTTSAGNNGTVFKIDPATGSMTTVKVFSASNHPDGTSPRGGLVTDADGYIWGTTFRGGGQAGSSTGYGTVFKINSLTGQFTSVIQFTGPAGTGSEPKGELALDDDGKVWGTTLQNVFTIDRATGTLSSNVPLASATGYPLELSLGGGLSHHHDGFYYGVNELAAMGPEGEIAGGGIVYRRRPGRASVTTTAHNPAGDVYPKPVNLAGGMDMDGAGGTSSFEWGPTTGLGTTTASVAVNLNATSANASIPQLKGLTGYFFRLKVDTAAGTAYGPIQSFVTRELGSAENLGITVQSPVGTPLVHNSSTINLGDVRVGQSRQESVTIKYIGSSSLTLSGVSITGANADQFTMSDMAVTPALTHAGSRGFVITYTPTGTGSHQATLTINSNDTTRPAFVVQLAGSGISEADIGLEVGPGIGLDTESGDAVDFGSGTVGVGIARQFLVCNSGNAALGNLTAEIIGANAADFSITDAVPGSLNAGASSTFGITFTPAAAAERAAILRLTSNDPDEGMVEIALTGRTPAAANIVVELESGGAIASGAFTGYGTVAIGMTLSKTFIIRNTGNAPMTGISATYSGGGSFTVSSAPMATLYPGEWTTVVVTFVPTTALPQQSTYTIASNAGNNAAFQLKVNGTGSSDPVPEIAVEDGAVGLTSNVGSIGLGSVQGGNDVTKTLTVRNSGTGALTGVAASFSVGSSTAFTITSGPAATIAAGATTSVTIRFSPLVNGAAAASLLIASNDSDENPFRINFTASGANVPEPEITVEENSVGLVDGSGTVNFGTAATNANVTKTFTIKNTGAASLTGINPTLAAGSNAAFSIITPPATATTLAVNASTTVAVRFAPASVGPVNGILRIASNDADENPFDIDLAGTGEPTSSPTFTAPPQSTLVLLGASASFSATVAGAPPIRYQWKKNGANVPANGTASDYQMAAAKAADVGTYTLFASNPSGNNTSPPAHLGLVTPLGGTVQLKEGGVLTLTCTAVAPKVAGVELRYRWHNSDGPLSDGGDISGAGTKSLKITNVGLEQTGAFTCEVTLDTAGNDPKITSGAVMVAVVQKPTLHPIVLTDVSVGETVVQDPVTADFAAKITAAGLPPGVTLNGQTGVLGGKPTAAKIVGGVEVPYQVKFTATNLAGTSEAVTVDWMVRALDPSLIGTFNGIVERDPFTNAGYGGTIQLTTTAKGAVTGSVVLAGKKWPVVGVLDASLGDNPTALVTVKRTPPSLGNLQLEIQGIEIDGDRLFGSIRDDQFSLITSSLEIGDGTAGFGEGSFGDVQFDRPGGIAILGEGGFIADTGNHVIRQVVNDTVSTFAGDPGSEGLANGTGGEARFKNPEGLALDADLNLYVADTGNAAIRKITPGGLVTTLTVPGGTFVSPCALAFDDKGNLVVVDRGNHTLWKFTPAGAVSLLAGKSGVAGHKDGAGAAALFNSPHGIVFDPVLKALFVADTGNCVIRKVSPNGAVSTYAGAAGIEGDGPGVLGGARFIAPKGITSDGEGTLIVADTLLVQITPGGIVATVTDYVDTATQADQPVALAFVPDDGEVIAADAGLHGITVHEGSDPLPGANFVARRNVWSNSNQVPLPNVGNYTAAIATSQPDDAAYPQGNGYATLAVSKTGAAMGAGKAADGSKLTFATTVGPDGEVALHTMLYKGLGSLQGMTYIDDMLDWFSFDTTVDWNKVGQPKTVVDRVYRGGFPLHSVNLEGGKYSPANNVFGFLGLEEGTTTSNATVMFTSGGLADPMVQVLDVKAPSTVSVPAASNPNGVKLSIAAATGIFTGSFNYGTPARKATVAGVLVRNASNGYARGRGHLLLPQDTTKDGPVLSGAVSIDAD